MLKNHDSKVTDLQLVIMYGCFTNLYNLHQWDYFIWKKNFFNVLTFNQTDSLSIYNGPDTEQQAAYIKDVGIIMPTLQMRKGKQLELQWWERHLPDKGSKYLATS